MPREYIEEVRIDDAKIMFRNFSGKEKKFNQEGDRNFTIFLHPETAKLMRKDGWNVRTLRLREDAEEGEEPQDVIEVAVSYKGRPPRIVMVTSGGRTPVDEETVNLLDHVEIDTVDVILNPYSWEANGNTGVKAYLKTMYIKIVEDPLDLKWAELEDQAEPE